MRILYVLNSLAVGGTERQVLAIAARMAARGHTALLVVLRPHEPQGCDTDLQVVHLDMGKTSVGFFAGARRALTVLHHFHPDLIHSHNFHGNMLARLLRMFYRAPRLISTIHNVYEGGWMRMMGYRITDRMAHATTAVSGAVRERYVRLNAVPPSKCVILTNGIDIKEFAPDGERRAWMRRQMGVSEEFVWLSVGRVAPQKDFPNLLQGFGQVRRTDRNTQLWIAGQNRQAGPSIASYQISTMLGAMDSVRRLGFRQDVAALLDAADGFVLSSAWEGMPLAVAEAMAMEKPVVATDVGGVRELVGDVGAIVAARDASALAQGMSDVMRKSPQDRTAMGRAGRERITASFNIEMQADQWEQLYQSVLR